MKLKTISLLLLDLDNTLWDFDANANLALTELFQRHHVALRTGKTAEEFIELYIRINRLYWEKYERGEISKEILRSGRFTDTFLQMGIPIEEHPENLWEEYLDICPRMPGMVPGALELLQEMHSKVRIGLITNGFEATQTIKIQSAGIDKYVDFMTTSEATGTPKPNPEIFAAALHIYRVNPSEALYIGDTWHADMEGAYHANIEAIFYNHIQAPISADSPAKPAFIHHDLKEITKFLLKNYQFRYLP